MWLRDTGVLNRMKDIILPAHIPTQYQKARHQQSLSVNQISMILITYIIGITLSIIAFILELLIGSVSKDNLPADESIELRGDDRTMESSGSE